MEETFYPQEEQKEERGYPHRPQSCGLFSCYWKAMYFTESLKKTIDFSKVYKNGKYRADKYIVVYCLKNDLKKNRLGISVSKKVGNSVIRHKLKRQVKESYRKKENLYKIGYDIVVVLRKSSTDCNYDDICMSLEKLFKKCNLYCYEENIN